MEMVLRAALVARGAMGTQDRPTVFQINKAKIRLLAQLAGGVLVFTIPCPRPRGVRRQD